MAKKESYQNIRHPRVRSVAKRELYGWVDEEVFTQSFMVTSDMLPELRREIRLTEDVASEEDYVLEVAGPFDRLPFQAAKDRTHFLWVYTELFTRLGIQLPFTDFQREVMTRCRVAASQLHLNDAHSSARKWVHVFPCPLGAETFLRLRGNPEVRECCITTLDPLETLAFQFHQSLPVGLGKKSNFKCRWILDHSNAEVGSHFDRLMQKMVEVEGACPCQILPHPRVPMATSGPGRNPRLLHLEREEGAKEEPSTDLRQKRQKRKVQESSPKEAALGADSTWEHEVNPIDWAFPARFNFWGALDSGLTLGPFGFADLLYLRYLYVGIENAFSAKVKLEKELAATKDQVNVLMAERDSALAAPLLKAKVDLLIEELRLAEGERLSALAHMKEVEEGAKVQVVELQSYCTALEQEKKKVESFTRSLEQKQTVLDEAEAAVSHWREEWKALAEETGEMVRETFEILMDQVRHLNLAVDYSMITLDSRWDPKGKRIFGALCGYFSFW
ncbi:hypothetical protein PIB30_075431 [Stylosanthes scabra]|uniref:Uncharacterized protein n=1 Tax=Stylosanthes scabra TaxID=79078 RepID=A0ABU6QQ44_9FABA|nr:hypothetical protein [Stylosanthes scabra]